MNDAKADMGLSVIGNIEIAGSRAAPYRIAVPTAATNYAGGAVFITASKITATPIATHKKELITMEGRILAPPLFTVVLVSAVWIAETQDG